MAALKIVETVAAILYVAGETETETTVTVKATALVVRPPTVTTTLPVVAPVGTETTIVVALQLVGVAAVPLKVTALVPCVAPKLVPVIATEVPTGPEVGERVVIVGGGFKLVSEKLAGVATPETDAVTVYGPPAVAFAVKTGGVARPDALVVAVFTPPAKVPLAPLAGGVNVTVTPLTGLLKESFTVACSCTAKAVLTVALCGVPAVAAILAAAPAKFVSEKFAEVPTPETEAVTV